MPTFQLTNKYRLSSDYYTWEMQERTMRKHRKTGELVTYWKPFKWYRTPEVALNEAFELCLRVSANPDICESIREAQNLLASVRQALKSDLMSHGMSKKTQNLTSSKG